MKRNRRLSRVSIAEGTIVVRIPVSFTTLNERGLLGWRIDEEPKIVTPISNSKTKDIIKNALRSFPKDINASIDEITVEIPVSYESVGDGKLGWNVGNAIIGSPASREMTIRIIREQLVLWFHFSPKFILGGVLFLFFWKFS